MKKLFLYFGKKALINSINEMLEKNKGDILKITNIISIWIERLEKIIIELKSINARVSDGHLTNDEMEETTEGLTNLVKQF